MQPRPGQTLSHYRLIEKIGEGGMGVVWSAEDTVLRRSVALKMLPEGFDRDAERLSRFEREARFLASLNHPNIAAIHGLEQADGARFLIMELVPGESLADRLRKGRLGVEESLKIAVEIARALEAAHEKGVIHRDLKPGNVQVTPKGQIKVLDFGLAKAFSAASSASELAEQPTMTAATGRNVIMGTMSYMSPEQASGQQLDKRTDIWAFGCVLYELLTGQCAFLGDTVTSTLAAIHGQDPDWERLPPETPAAIQRLLRRCLDKNVDRRLHDVADARIVIEDVSADRDWMFDATAIPTAEDQRRRLSPWLVSAVLGIVGLVAIAIVGQRFLTQQTSTPPALTSRLSVVLPPEAPLAPTGSMPLCVGQPSLALSPDGRFLVYVALVDGQRLLYRRDMVTGRYDPLTGTEGARSPFFSPDGQWVAFFTEESLQKVSIAGGDPIPLADAGTNPRGAVWAEEGSIYFNADQIAGKLWKVSADGGPVEAFTAEGSWPEMLPGGEQLLVALGLRARDGLAVLPLEEPDRARRLSVPHSSYPRYLANGALLYVTEAKLMAVGFDVEAARIVGSPVVMLDDLRTGQTAASQFAVSATGTLVYAPGLRDEEGSFVWVDRQGRKEYPGIEQGIFGEFKLSPDGKLLAYPVTGVEGQDLWIHEFSRGRSTRLSFGGSSSTPVWSADSRSLFYMDGVSGEIVWQPADRSREPHSLLRTSGKLVSIADEGRLHVREGFSRLHVYTIVMDDEGRPIEAKLEDTVSTETIGFTSVSPDGRWLAYTEFGRGRRWENAISPFPGLDRRIQISTSGGEEPRWRPDGEEIVYRWGPRWFGVDVQLAPEVRVGPPRLLFEGPYVNLGGFEWDMSPDGQRFLLIENPQQDRAPTELVVVTNFFDEVDRRLEAGR